MTMHSWAACGVLLGAAAAQMPPPGFQYQVLSDGQFALASAMAFAPDGRLFVIERVTGRILVFADGALQATPWATVPSSGSEGSEQGLLGIAVDPAFLANGFVYVFYTDAGQDCVLARLQEQNGMGTNLTVLTQPGSILAGFNHNSGRMVFGQDGMLYVGTGEHGDPSLAQNLASWNGKVLRLQPPDLTVPAGNPFPGSPVFSYGHRNQFGLTVHPVTGRIYQTENGLTTTDEVNLLQPGGNYGWPLYEGPAPVPDPSVVDPVASWSPTVSPVGTCFYHGELWPAAYQDSWFVLHYNTRAVVRLQLDQGGATVVGQTTFDMRTGQGLDVQMGPDGNLWYLVANVAAVRGANQLGRWVHAQAPSPAVHLMATSNRAVGGAMTIGCTGQNGTAFVAWFGYTRSAVPTVTMFGDQWVSVDSVLPILPVVGDGRVYHGVPIRNVPALIGATVHCQAAQVTANLQVTLSNAASLTVR